MQWVCYYHYAKAYLFWWAVRCRIEKLRENLPSYYEQILKEKMDRVIAHEAEKQVSKVKWQHQVCNIFSGHIFF